MEEMLKTILEEQQWENIPRAKRDLPKKWIGTIYEEDGAITDLDIGVKYYITQCSGSVSNYGIESYL